jgi:ATP-binding cassette subfamily A (ABC1) protein 3
MKQGECFGLLGVNGAGKTTTFKMMTGDEEITSGEVYVNRFSIKTARSEAQQQIGYCPQFNALIESLTAYETLELFSKLRGMKPEFIESQSDQILKLLGLKVHAEHRCGTYSGGNKRKLSVGLAMVGQPALLFLDEPSTGMDPGARHALWEALSTIRKQGTSIVVTSHSMEECEALCTRLGIMVNGQFKALGSLQHLKNKFGRGYTLELQLNNISSSDKVKKFIENSFKTASLKEEFSSQITYDIMVNGGQKSDDDSNVENSDISLGRIFGLMEENKEELDLQGYSLCQRTLEQIFLGFTKLQSN